jgi:hypothetical protein
VKALEPGTLPGLQPLGLLRQTPDLLLDAGVSTWRPLGSAGIRVWVRMLSQGAPDDSRALSGPLSTLLPAREPDEGDDRVALVDMVGAHGRDERLQVEAHVERRLN